MSQHNLENATIDVNIEEGVHRIFTVCTPNLVLDDEITVVVKYQYQHTHVI